MIVRLAKIEDANQGICVLRSSIIKLCENDHHSNMDQIKDWLANKTTDIWCNWVNSAKFSLFITELDEVIAGVSMISLNGVILLNYVSPDYRFKGVSKAMLNHMEEFAKNIGILMCTLQSTYTYKDFKILMATNLKIITKKNWKCISFYKKYIYLITKYFFILL